MKTQKLSLAAVHVALIAFSGICAEPSSQVNWKSSVTSGDYSLGTNWEGDAAPLAAGQTATFALGEATGAYTATIPATGLTDCAMTYLKAIGPSASLVLDATGATWTKGAGAYAAADQAFRVTDTDGKTILNLSNVDTTGATGVFTLTDGKFSYDGATKVFSVDGAWNLGTATLDLGSVSAAQVRFNAGSQVTTKILNVNGTTPLVVNGGTHTFSGTTYIGHGSWANSKVRILGGTATATGTTYLCGPDAGHSKGELEVGGTASVTLGATSMSQGYSSDGQTARFRTTGTGTLSFTGQCQTRVTNGGSLNEFIAEDDSTLNMPETVDYLTSGSLNAALVLQATNNATMVINNMQPFYDNNNKAKSSRINFFGHSTAVIPSGKSAYFSLLRGDGSVNTNCFMAAEDATVRVKGTLYLGDYFNSMTGLLLLKDRARLVLESSGTLSVARSNGRDAGLLIRDQAEVMATNNISIAKAHGVIDMEGGSMTVKGFTMSGTASATRPRFAANGSTIRPIIANDAFLTGFSLAELSGAGLTLDDNGLAVGISQAFTGTTFAKTGAGTLTVKADSSHDTTAVANGTLAFAGGVATFGNALVITNGAVVSTVGDSTGLTLTALTLGDATTAGTVMLDNTDVIALPNDAALTVNEGKIVLSDPLTVGDVGFLKVTSGTITAEKLEKLTLVNASITREYEFKIVADGDGAKIVLTIAEVTTHEQTWTGATDAVWETAGNWNPAATPTSSSLLAFPAGLERTNLVVSTAAQAQDFAIAGNYSFEGTGSLLLPNLTLEEGANATFDLPVSIPTGLAPVTPDGTSLAFNGPLTCSALYGITFAGARSFRLAGDSEDFLGFWDFNAVTGRVTFAGANSAGAATKDKTLLLGPGTITTEGADEIVINNSTTLDPGKDTYSSILDTDAPTTFANGLTVNSGAFIKTGTNTLKIVYPSGTYYLGRKGDACIADRQGFCKINLPANGAGTVGGDYSGISEYSVLEGTLELTPQSGLLSKPTVNGGPKHAAIGANYSNEVEAVLWLHGAITMTGGYNSQYWTVGCFTPNGAAAHPTLRVTDGATFSPYELALGANNYAWGTYGTNRTMPYYPTLAVTNATVRTSSILYLGSARWYPSDVIHPTVRIGPSGSAGSDGSISFCVNVDAIVDGGSVSAGTFGFGCDGTQGAKNYSGEMRFINGGSLSVSSFSSRYSLADKTRQTRLRFDNGKLSLTKTATSSVSDPTNVTFVAEQGGLTVSVGSGLTHTFALQLAGAGPVTKTGAGTLVLTNRADTAILDSTVKHFAGAFTVAEGTVDFGGQDISQFAALGGAGTLRNATGGRLTLAAKKDVTTTLSNVQLDLLKVDLSSYGDTLELGDALTVAKLTGGSTAASIASTRLGGRLRAAFSVDADGNLVGTVVKSTGGALIVR